MVIGAGAAGLAAARMLVEAGCDVRVLEARDRAGGRIHSLHDPRFDLPVELGAEFVHGMSPVVWDLIREHGLVAVGAEERHARFENGRLSADDGFFEKVQRVLEKLDVHRHPDRSFEAFLEEELGGRRHTEERRQAASYVEGFHAAHVEWAGEQGLAHTTSASAREDGDRMFRLVGGYDRLTHLLVRAVGPERLVLGRTVEEVRWKTGAVEVIARVRQGPTREVLRAKRVIVTLPLAVLQAGPGEDGAVRFFPAIPAKTRATGALRMGHVRRVVLRFQRAPWELRHQPMPAFMHAPQASTLPVWWTLAPVQAPVLVGWAGGPRAEALTAVGDRELLRRAMDEVSGLFDIPRAELSRNLVGAWTHDWSNDPHSRGAYAYLGVDGLAAQLMLAAPIAQTLFFAGEACDVTGHVGTVQGALLSGERAARECLQALREQAPAEAGASAGA